MKNPPTKEMLEWLIDGETGFSSRTMLRHHLGLPGGPNDMPPGDCNDLDRCMQLVDSCPEVIQSFGVIGQLHPVWRAVTENWHRLEELWRQAPWSDFVAESQRIINNA